MPLLTANRATPAGGCRANSELSLLRAVVTIDKRDTTQYVVQYVEKPRKRSMPLSKPKKEAENATPSVDRIAPVREDCIT